MQVTAEHPDPCTVVLDINVDEQQVARVFETTYKEFGRYANVPGFRPGKAPRAILERYVNAEKVRQQALEKIIRDSYFKAIEGEGIVPYRDPRIDPTDLEDKKPYTYKATVPLEPQVTLGDYTGLTVEKPVYTVTDEMVETRLNALREERARLERVTDRGVQPGDILIVEQQIKMEGDEGEPGQPRRQLVQTGNNVPGYDDAIMGLAIGEERPFDIIYPEDYEEEDKRGKTASYTVKLSSISAKKLPELNDDLAVALGAGQTVDELRNGVRTRLQAEADQYSNQVAEQRVFEQILDSSTIHFPDVLVREEVEDELRRLSQELRQNNVNYSQYLQSIGGLTPEQHQSGLAQQAAQQIQTLLALREISIQEDLQATEEQVDTEYDRLLNESVITDEQYEEFKADPRRRLQVANALIQQRLHDFLFANNTINAVEQTGMPGDDELEDAAEEAEAAATDGLTEDATAETSVSGESDEVLQTPDLNANAFEADTNASGETASQETVISAAETTDGGVTKTD
jgi:trigger factor